MKAAIYARLSAETEDEDNYPQQVADCRVVAEELDWDVVEVIEEPPHSAYEEAARRRQGFQRLRELVDTGAVTAIVVRDADRLSRDIVAYADLLRNGNHVRMATTDGTSKPLSEWAEDIAAAARESRVKSRRQLAAERRIVARGQQPRGGRRQYGYHSRSASCGCGLELCPHPPKYRGDCRCGPDRCRQHAIREDEKKIILEIIGRWLDDRQTFADLARDVNARGVPTSTGKPWTAGRIGRLVYSRRLASIRTHKGSEKEGAWEPIIDEELRTRILDAKEERSKHQRPHEHYLLRGLVMCAACDAPMQGSRHANVSRRYRCAGKCSSGIAADPVDRLIWAAALGRTWHRDRASEELARARLTEVKRQRIAAVSKRDELDRRYWQDDDVDRRTYDQQYGKLSQRVKDLDAERKQLERQLDEADKFWVSLQRMAEHYMTATWDERRAVLTRAIDRVVVEPNGHASADYPTDSDGDPITVDGVHHNVKLDRVGVLWR